MLGTSLVEVVVNGEPRQFPAGLTVEGVLAALDVEASRVAVELNRQIVRRVDWPTTAVPPGASLEIVHFVGGG